jgi:hypothetical protein
MRSRALAGCLVVIVLATGCSKPIAGQARPAPGLIPRPLTGETIKGALLDAAALSKILQQPFESKADLPPRFGGPEKLQATPGAVSPSDCAGIARLADKSTYKAANVKNVARETWWNKSDTPAKVIDVEEGVVALPTIADASALFRKFSQQWDSCNGKTVTIQAGPIIFSDNITEVRVTDSVVAATLSNETRLSGSPTKPLPVARAVGVRGNCLVEVEVAFFSAPGPSDQGSGDVHDSAIDIARAMMDKVTGLS